MSGEVTREIVIRVNVPPRDGERDQSVSCFYSFETAMRMAYRWGGEDARAESKDLPLAGVHSGWTVAGVSLDWLREDTSSVRRD